MEEPKKPVQPRSVSLGELDGLVDERLKKIGRKFSAYIQLLIAYDLEHGLIPEDEFARLRAEYVTEKAKLKADKQEVKIRLSQQKPKPPSRPGKKVG